MLPRLLLAGQPKRRRCDAACLRNDIDNQRNRVPLVVGLAMEPVIAAAGVPFALWISRSCIIGYVKQSAKEELFG